jgi:hypothetical protein
MIGCGQRGPQARRRGKDLAAGTRPVVGDDA